MGVNGKNIPLKQPERLVVDTQIASTLVEWLDILGILQDDL